MVWLFCCTRKLVKNSAIKLFKEIKSIFTYFLGVDWFALVPEFLPMLNKIYLSYRFSINKPFVVARSGFHPL